jgi:hypothetical protein
LSFSLPRIAGTAVLALTATALTLPLAPSARASTPIETQFFISDKVADVGGNYGLYRRVTTGGSILLVGDTATTDVTEVAVSTEGSRFIEVENTYDSSGNPLRTHVVAYDVSGRRVRVLQDLDANLFAQITPDLSPDGTTATWSIVNQTTHGVTLYKATVGYGSPVALASNVAGAVFADATTLILEDVAGPWEALPISGGIPTSLSAIPQAASQVVVSPDGGSLAWSFGTSDTTADIQVAPLSFPGGTLTVGSATTVATGSYDYSPSFTRDGLSVEFVRFDGSTGALYTTPVNGSSTTGTAVDSTSVGDVDGQAMGSSDDGTAPGGTTSFPAVLNGTSATLSWTLPTDTDLSGMLFTRKVGSTVEETVYVPAPVTSYVDTGLVVGGALYTYTFFPVDRSNHLGTTAAVRNLIPLKAAPTFADPTSTTSAKASFPVTFGPANTGWFTVDYLIAGTTTWHSWVTHAAGRTRTFGAAASTGVAATTSTPGTNYVFRVKIADSYGNATAWVSSIRAVVPYDQTKATLVGGTNVAASAAYLGGYRRLSKTTDYAKITAVGNRLQVVGIKCSSCGSFDVYDGTTRIATISSYTSGTSVYRAVLFTRSYTGTHTFTIRPRATAGHPYVMLDGFGMRR